MASIYQALGKFFVEFSRLVSKMEGGLSIVSGVAAGKSGGERVQSFVHAIVIELTADPLARAWRSVMMQAVDLTNDDLAVLSGLAIEISKLINLRNDWAHGSWDVGDESIRLRGDQPGEEILFEWPSAGLMRFKNSARGVVSPSNLEEYPTAEYIEKAAAHTTLVANAVHRYGLIVAAISTGGFSDARPSDDVRVTKMGGGRQQVKIRQGIEWQSSEWP